jgi:hypothetical protein
MADLAVARFQCGQHEEAKMLGVSLLESLKELFATSEHVITVGKTRQRAIEPAQECQRDFWAAVHAFFTLNQCLTSHVLAAAVLGQDHLDVSAISECPRSSTTRVEVILSVQMAIIKRWRRMLNEKVNPVLSPKSIGDTNEY